MAQTLRRIGWSRPGPTVAALLILGLLLWAKLLLVTNHPRTAVAVPRRAPTGTATVPTDGAATHSAPADPR